MPPDNIGQWLCTLALIVSVVRLIIVLSCGVPTYIDGQCSSVSLYWWSMMKCTFTLVVSSNVSCYISDRVQAQLGGISMHVALTEQGG